MIGFVLALSLLGAPAVAGESVVCRFTDERLVEISGMALSQQHPDVLWVHNDSSHGPYLYAVSATSCQTLARIEIADVEARDFEGMALGVDRQGRSVIWLGDIGDNRDSWPFVRVHRIREPRVIRDQVVQARTYQVTYPDGPLNAETLMADGQRLWIVTKQLARGRLYALPDPLRKRNTATYIREEGPLITDGAIAPSGKQYVLRDYVNATIYRGLPPGEPVMKIELPLQVQGEAITWSADEMSLLITSERDDRLIRIPIPARADEMKPEAESAQELQPQVAPESIAEDSTSEQSTEWWLIPVMAAVVLGVIALAEWLRRRGRQRR